MIASATKRDKAGLFRSGTAPGPGRPASRAREFEKRYLALTRECVSEEDWRQIINMAVKCARFGDPKARDFLAKYVLPPLPVIIAGLEVHNTTVIESPDAQWRDAIARATPEQLKVLRDLIATNEPATN